MLFKEKSQISWKPLMIPRDSLSGNFFDKENTQIAVSKIFAVLKTSEDFNYFLEIIVKIKF